MAWIQASFCRVEVPNGWTYRKAHVVGCGTIASGVLGLVCLVVGWFVVREGVLSDWLRLIGVTLALLGAAIPAAYSLIWFRSSEMEKTPARLAGDLCIWGMILKGPDGQWLHLVADELKQHERPMDRHEMETAFQSHYGDRFLAQGWIPHKYREIHWGTYRLADKVYKKYTMYLKKASEERVEIVLTARLGNPPNAQFEGQYDAISTSIGLASAP